MRLSSRKPVWGIAVTGSVLGALALINGFLLTTARAASDGGEVSLPQTFNPAGMAPQFTPGNDGALKNIMGACVQNWMSSPEAQMANSLIQGGGQIANTINNPVQAPVAGMNPAMGANACTLPPVAPDLTMLTCPPGQPLDPMLAAKYNAAVDAALASITCRKNLIQSASNELKCLADQAQRLSEAAGSLTNTYAQNIARMEQDVHKLTEIEEDRDSQIKDAEMKLKGDPQGGAPGLLKLQEQTLAMTAAMPAEVQKVKEAHEEIKRARKGLEEQAQKRTMTLASQCLNERPEATYQCVPNGPPVSAKEYVLCRFEQNQYIGKDGRLERPDLASESTKAKAKGQRAALESLLNNMMGEAPLKPGSAPQAEGDHPVTIMTVADIEMQYGDKLAAFNGKGLDIHDFVIKSAGSCFQRAQVAVGRERKRSSSGAGQEEAKIKQMERTASTEVNNLLNKYSQQYSDNMAGMTGMHLPLNVSACRKSKPETQAGCLEDIKTNLDRQLSGDHGNSQMKIEIRGRNSAGTIRTTCSGINGCIRSMQAVVKNLNTDKARWSKFKKQYVMAAKQNVQAYTKQMAAMLSPQSQMLQARIRALNGQLSVLGGGVQQIQTQPMRTEQLQFDPETGLPKPPENSLALIAGSVNPPLMDMNAGAFTSAAQGFGAANQDLDQKAVQINMTKSVIAQKAQQCSAQLVQTALTQANSTIAQIGPGGCRSPEYCDKNKLAELAAMAYAIQPGVGGASPTEVFSLQSGVSGLCSGAKTGSATGKVGENDYACGMINQKLGRDLMAIKAAQEKAGMGSGMAR